MYFIVHAAFVRIKLMKMMMIATVPEYIAVIVSEMIAAEAKR